MPKGSLLDLFCKGIYRELTEIDSKFALTEIDLVAGAARVPGQSL